MPTQPRGQADRGTPAAILGPNPNANPSGPRSLSSPGEAARRREAKRKAAAVWMLLTLGAIALMGILIIGHLIRRGRLIRSRLGPPRDARLPDQDELDALRPPRLESSKTPSPKDRG